MSCMLRIKGTHLKVNDLQKVDLKYNKIWEIGTPVFKSKPDGKKHIDTGANCIVSDAEFAEFEIQKSDAIKFLREYESQIKEIRNLPGFEGAALDFGIYWRDVPMQCDFFPPELIKLAGNLELGIELSQYTPSDIEE